MTDVQERPTETVERKRMETLWWAGVLIWIGLALGAESLDLLPGIGEAEEWWPWIFLGVGPWSLAFNTYLLASTRPNPTTWDWIWTAVFMAVAIGSLVEFEGEIVGAIALVVIGVIVMYRGVTNRD